MSGKSLIHHWSRGCALLCATLLATTALAGIPEPGLVLRGKVLDDNDNLVTTGTLQWTFTPQGTGEPVTVTTHLEEMEGDGGPYSYQVIVPLETRVSGFPDNPDALPVNATTTYRRGAELLNTSIRQAATTITIDAGSRGRVIRADVGFQDDDGDGLPDDWEITHFGKLGEGPEDDYDMDGLTNQQEFDLGTDPTKVDTDNDGFTDAEEVANGTDPTIPTPTVASVSPNRAWLFGGAVAEIAGRGFNPADSTVLFNGVEAELASGETNTDTELHVIVPPLYDPPSASGAEVEVDVTVRNATESDTASYTYVRFTKAEESNGSATGDVTTNAFVFSREDGSGNLTLVLDGDNPDINGVLNIPPIANQGTGDIFAVVRATRTPALAGADMGFPGDAINNAWNFSIHLYDSEPPFTEYNNVGFAEGAASLTFPIDGTGINTTEVGAGEIGLFSIASDFDFTFGDTAHTVTGSAAEGQYTVRATDLVNNGESVTVQMNHFSSFGLRRGVDVIDPVVNEVQTLTVDATGGTFTLTFDGATTDELDFDLSAGALQAALESLPTIGDGNVSVSQNDDGSFSILFTGALGGQDMPELEGDGGALTGGAGIAVRTDIDGDSTTLVVSPGSQLVGAAGGSIELTVSNEGNETLNWTATVDAGADFLSITAGASGVNDGTITVNVAENTTDMLREGSIRVAAGDEVAKVAIAQNSATARLSLEEIAQLLLDGFTDADANMDGQLSFDEARTIVGDLTQEEFDLLGGADDEMISMDDLDATFNPEPCEGCNCPDGGVRSLSTGDIIKGIEKALGDLFLFGMAIVTLLGFSMNRGR